MNGTGRNLLDDAMRERILDVARRMNAQPTDLPALGRVHEDAFPFCWNAPEAGWHLTVQERDKVLSDRHTTDPEEFVFWVAQAVSEAISLRLYPPGQPDFRRNSWHAQYRILDDLDPSWGQAWLRETREALTAAGADHTTLDKLPSPSG